LLRSPFFSQSNAPKDEKEGSAMMSGLFEESDFKIALCGFNPMKRDLQLKGYIIDVPDHENRPCHSSSSARKSKKIKINPNRKLITFLVAKDFRRNSHAALGSHLYSFNGLSV
jgi:hypothetical protein